MSQQLIFLSFGNTTAWSVYVYVDIILLISFWKGICRDCLILEAAKASGGTCLPPTLCPGSYMQNCECLGCTFLRNGSTVLIRFPKRLAEMNHRYVTINILCWFLKSIILIGKTRVFYVKVKESFGIVRIYFLLTISYVVRTVSNVRANIFLGQLLKFGILNFYRLEFWASPWANIPNPQGISTAWGLKGKQNVRGNPANS